jgi:hypothetical protein
VRRLADLPQAVLVEMSEAAFCQKEQHFEPRILPRWLIEMFRELC